MIGNQRKYVTALIVPEFETLKIYANNNNITYTSKEELVKNSRIIELFEKSIQEKMVNFARFEQIKRISKVFFYGTKKTIMNENDKKYMIFK